MRKFVVGALGNAAFVIVLVVAAPALGQQFEGPPPPGTVAFANAQPLNANMTRDLDNQLFKAPIIGAEGSVVAYFRRVEVHDGVAPVGIITLKDANRTIAVPLETLRVIPNRKEMVSEMSWLELNTTPSGRREPSSPWYPFGRPAAG